jgi:hypothetical protein
VAVLLSIGGAFAEPAGFLPQSKFFIESICAVVCLFFLIMQNRNIFIARVQIFLNLQWRLDLPNEMLVIAHCIICGY